MLGTPQRTDFSVEIVCLDQCVRYTTQSYPHPTHPKQIQETQKYTIYSISNTFIRNILPFDLHRDLYLLRKHGHQSNNGFPMAIQSKFPSVIDTTTPQNTALMPDTKCIAIDCKQKLFYFNF